MLTLTLLSIRFLDLPLAAWIAEHLRAHALYVKTANVPDLLAITVAFLSAVCWSAYTLLIRRSPSRLLRSAQTLCRVVGTALPIAFGIKVVLKWLFGRIEPRTWLLDSNTYGFHWFGGTNGYQGFPSGHMLVLTPLFMALWHCFPRYRILYSVACFLLAGSLLAMDYHYLSDVIAGTYIGAVVYLAVSRIVR